jgi:tRNA (guanine37-N1)-methyltransferase
MTIYVLSLFPEIVEQYFGSSIFGKAVERGLIRPISVDIRDFATDKHQTADDTPYGGGAGMVLQAGPLGRALDSVYATSRRTIYASPAGRRFTQETASELAREEELVFICGRYEGIDERIIDLYVDDELSIGDYVISSGELAALVMIDAVYRLREDVIARESLEEESFTDGLLEYPHYTRPEVYRGMRVPDVLLSGHHRRIRDWRRRRRVEKTQLFREDLLGPTDL